MKIIPILTEKSFSEAKKGFFTFWVESSMTKSEIKKAVEAIFDVHVRSVHTMNYKGKVKKNWKQNVVKVKAKKKAIVTLKGDEKIDIFVEKGK